MDDLGGRDLVIRDVDPATTEALRLRAALHGRSLEEEVRALLEAAADEAPPPPRDGTREQRDAWVRLMMAKALELTGGVMLEDSTPLIREARTGRDQGWS